ncbi:cobyrinate a,c-diamide synthase [Humidesulfovibrio idahonensis]
MTKALVLGGTHSGCGKTSVSLGLLRALARRGLCVQPFKAGPDFIDPGLHARAAGRPSHNLDTWMQPEPALRGIFCRHARGADVVLVEGVMGLFDGRTGTGEQGSTAHLAKLLGLPAVLVVDAGSQARSAAALVQGFARFDPALRLAGVVLNRVGSPRHESLLREALALAPEAPVLGCLPRREDVALASRHLGLVTEGDAEALQSRLEALADWVEQGIDIDALLAALPELNMPELAGPKAEAPEAERSNGVGRSASSAIGKREAAHQAAHLEAGLAPGQEPCPLPSPMPEHESGQDLEPLPHAAPGMAVGASPCPVPSVRIGVARDRAFCFLYEENLRLLAEAGAELHFFSPLAEAALPDGLDGLYLPGGYPELAARELSANAPMREAVRAFCASGRPVWAECGGYMYLLRELADAEGRAWPMCGALSGRAVMRARRSALGYREARTVADGPFGPAGTLLRGHEFHYSEYEGGDGDACGPAFALTDASGREALDGQAAGNVVGGYFHAHLASNPEAARAFALACSAGRHPGGWREDG